MKEERPVVNLIFPPSPGQRPAARLEQTGATARAATRRSATHRTRTAAANFPSCLRRDALGMSCEMIWTYKRLLEVGVTLSFVAWLVLVIRWLIG